MATASASPRTYPLTVNANGTKVTLRLMTRADAESSVLFARTLPEEDLMFLTIDITDSNEMAQYVQAVESGYAVTVLAEVNGRFIGYGSLQVSRPHWTRHLGEMRLLLHPDFRGHGLGRILANEIFRAAEAKGLRKLIARMATSQRGAQKVFEKLGFTAEAMLNDFVMDRHGRTHDLIVMTYDMTGLTE